MVAILYKILKMATAAQSSITLVSVSDAYSVSLQPSNITIITDPYGENANLDGASTVISLFCGDTQVPIVSSKITGSSLWKVASENPEDCTLTSQGGSVVLSITLVDQSAEGWREIEITTPSGEKLKARFAYSIVRETTMLDWVLDWNKNYTDITGDHISTPNALIGRKNSSGKLSGVYIGADMPNHSVGIYGFKDCPMTAFAQGNIDDYEIFFLNETGGGIGGWSIAHEGIVTSNAVGQMELLSSGTIQYLDKSDTQNPFWCLRADGSGVLAHGNIFWNVAGDATFKGTLQAAAGNVGGWHIGSNSFYHSHIFLNSTDGFIGVKSTATAALTSEPTTQIFYNMVCSKGGVVMTSSAQMFGLEGWNASGRRIFSLGSDNTIAGWKMDFDSIFLGTKCNTKGQYASSVANGILTMGTNGLRGLGWYIDSDGEIDFVGGRVHFNKDGGKIAGWSINTNHFSSDNAAIVSDTTSGVYFSANGALPAQHTAYSEHITEKGGIFIETSSTLSRLMAYNTSGNQMFGVSADGTGLIAGWSFDKDALYLGTKCNLFRKYASEVVGGVITIGTNGIRGLGWYIDTDGTISMAKGSVKFESTGGVISGWKISSDAFWTDHVALTTRASSPGLFLSSKGVFNGAGNCLPVIEQNGGIYLRCVNDKTELVSIDENKKTAFCLSSSGLNQIAGFKFGDKYLFTGDSAAAKNTFDTEGNVTISPTGIRGFKWRLEADGSGAVAGNNIVWSPTGDVTLGSSIKISVGGSYSSLSETLTSVMQFMSGFTTLLHPVDASGNNLPWSQHADAVSLKVEKNLWSVGDIAAFGPASGTSTGGNGGLNIDELEDYLQTNQYITESWALTQGFITATDAQSLYQPKGNYLTQQSLAGYMKTADADAKYVTRTGAQIISGTKTFAAQQTIAVDGMALALRSPSDANNMRVALLSQANWGEMRLYGKGGHFTGIRVDATATRLWVTKGYGTDWSWDVRMQVGTAALMQGTLYLAENLDPQMWWDSESARIRVNKPLVSSGIMYAERFLANTTNICTNLNADLLDNMHLADILNSNVASATKWQTARRFWGQLADGTDDVSGDMSGVGNIAASGRVTAAFDPTGYSNFWASEHGQLLVKTGTAAGFYSFGIGVRSADGVAQLQASQNGVGGIKLLLNPKGGNVGIGNTTNPQYPLDVHGQTRANGLISESFDALRLATVSGDLRMRVCATDNWSSLRMYGNAGRYIEMHPDAGGNQLSMASCLSDSNYTFDVSLLLGSLILRGGKLYLDAQKKVCLYYDAEADCIRINKPLVGSGDITAFKS